MYEKAYMRSPQFQSATISLSKPNDIHDNFKIQQSKPQHFSSLVTLRKHNTEIFSAVKNENFTRKKLIFLIYIRKILCGYTLEQAVLTSTHSLGFEAKKKKKKR